MELRPNGIKRPVEEVRAAAPIRGLLQFDVTRLGAREAARPLADARRRIEHGGGIEKSIKSPRNGNFAIPSIPKTLVRGAARLTHADRRAACAWIECQAGVKARAGRLA